MESEAAMSQGVNCCSLACYYFYVYALYHIYIIQRRIDMRYGKADSIHR